MTLPLLTAGFIRLFNSEPAFCVPHHQRVTAPLLFHTKKTQSVEKLQVIVEAVASFKVRREDRRRVKPFSCTSARWLLSPEFMFTVCLLILSWNQTAFYTNYPLTPTSSWQMSYSVLMRTLQRCCYARFYFGESEDDWFPLILLFMPTNQMALKHYFFG